MDIRNALDQTEKAQADTLAQELTAYASFQDLVLSPATPTLRLRLRKDGQGDKRHARYNRQIRMLQGFCLAVGKRYWDGN